MKVRSRHNYKYKRRLQIVGLALVLIVSGLFLPKIISGVAGAIIYPFHTVSVWLNESSGLVPTLFRDRKMLLEKIQSLENDLVALEKNNLTQKRLLEENNSLRGLLGIDEQTRIAAAVIARPNELPYDLLQIDRGTANGVEVGAPVFIGSDIVIGLVVHAADKYSFVEMVTTPGFESTAFISGPNVVVTLEGVGGGVARVKVPQGVHMSVGDMVYLPSVEPGVFGEISLVENRPTQPEQYGYITPDLAIAGLYRVSVGTLSQATQSVEQIKQQARELVRKSLLHKNLTIDFSSTTASTTPEETTQ